MDQWLKILRDSLTRENEDRPTVMILATLSRNGSPRARCVVCRAIDNDGSIWFVSDKRSRKNEQIRMHRTVELVFWLPNLKRQYRVRGEGRIAAPDDARTGSLWHDLPDTTRATFFWPEPGAPKRDDAEFAREIGSDIGPPANFQAIAIHPTLVEELDLTSHPHRRQRWRRKTQWRVQQLNP